MSLVFGYLSNDFSLVASAFHQLAPALDPAVDDDRLDWGIGFIQNAQALLRKKLGQPAEGFEIEQLVVDLRSQCIVGLALERSDARSGAHIPPYRSRNWLLAQSHRPASVDRFRDQLADALPDHVTARVRSQHPSALLLYFALQQVRRAAERASPSQVPSAAARGLAEAVRTVREWAREHNEEKPPIQNYLLTDGSLLIASCSGAPAYYSRIAGIFDDPLHRSDPLFAGHRPKRVDHPTFRAAVVAFGTGERLQSWQAIPDQSVVYVDPRYQVCVEPIEA